LVKELKSNDISCQEKTFAKVDQFISSLEEVEQCKTTINKTVINKHPSSENLPQVQYSFCIKNVTQQVNKNINAISIHVTDSGIIIDFHALYSYVIFGGEKKACLLEKKKKNMEENMFLQN